MQSLLDEFHANEELQDLCATVDTNARRYLILVQDDQQDQKYKSVVAIPAGTLLAVYFGSLERVRPGEENSLNHSMDQGKIDFKYDLRVDGTPRAGDTHPGRLQLVNHSCEPRNNAVSEEWNCSNTGLIAFFLRSKKDISPDVEVTFPYQEPTFQKGVQVYPSTRFWKHAASLPPVRKGRHMVQCNCAGTPGRCPNGYGRHERDREPPPPTPPTPHTTLITLFACFMSLDISTFDP